MKSHRAGGQAEGRQRRRTAHKKTARMNHGNSSVTVTRLTAYFVVDYDYYYYYYYYYYWLLAHHMTGCHNIHALLHGLFDRCFFILKANQLLILFTGVLPPGVATSYYILDA
jgi:hypothetical protein